MVYLLLSIFCNTAIYIIFKWFELKTVKVLPALVVNYLTAFLIGLIVVPDLSLALKGASELPLWVLGGCALGIFFISVFYLVALSTQHAGVSVTTIASKISLALAAILFVVVDPGEFMTVSKAIAIVLALAGVVCASIKKDGRAFTLRSLGGPLLILLGCTVVDFGIAHFSVYPQNESELALYSCLSFGTAGVGGMIVLVYKVAYQKFAIRSKDVIAGFLLGIVNYGSIYFLVKAYDSQLLPKSAMLPINNLGVVLLGSLGAILLFREKLSTINIAGIALSIIAMVLLAT